MTPKKSSPYIDPDRRTRSRSPAWRRRWPSGLGGARTRAVFVGAPAGASGDGRLVERPQWRAHREAWLERLVRDKFRKDKALLEQLRKTGNRELVFNRAFDMSKTT